MVVVTKVIAWLDWSQGHAQVHMRELRRVCVWLWIMGDDAHSRTLSHGAPQQYDNEPSNTADLACRRPTRSNVLLCML